ncbi:MAG: threonylcarbamoyl-AMP synthase [Treponema sp.]|jgi:L-threonylcarbamoyladenylate synthase|nr:threonylcarbamoyl-AMP synthase [Treponema sp.]
MNILPVNADSIALGAEIIVRGGLVAFPTETVYGLGADALNPGALARIFEAKGRPRFDPLIIHIAAVESLENAADLSRLDRETRRILDILTLRLWPGPLTLVLPKQPWVPGLATSGLPTAAVRFPAHPAAQELIRHSTGVVAAPSANPFGYLSPTRAEHVRAQLGDKADLILDGGRTPVGVESTVLDLSAGPPRILRPGGVSRERIEALIGPVGLPNAPGDGGVPAPLAPGQLKSHYAPRTPLSVYPQEVMASLKFSPHEGYLFFDAPSRDAWLAGQQDRLASRAFSSAAIQTLSFEGNLREAAANLFDLLHLLDGLGLSHIRAELAPPPGLGPAINDRLMKAAARI